MLDITIVAIGKLKEKYFAEAFLEYEKRLRPYARLKIVELPAVPFSKLSQAKAKEKEGEQITNFLENKARDHVRPAIYLLAERGKTFNSQEMAAWLNKNQPLVLIIGGALGFSPALYEKYPQISLSELTFPHELARVVLVEQIYRAVTIINKKEYNY